MRSIVWSAALAAALGLLAGCGAPTTGSAGLPPPDGGQSAAVSPGSPGRFALPPDVVPACPPAADVSVAHCLALIRRNTGSGPSQVGYIPSDIQDAYKLPSSTQGTGQTIAVVDAYDDPKVIKDLAVYRAAFGLPPCGAANSCFLKVNQLGQHGHFPVPDSGWAFEESLDVDMISAVCPNCHIILVEAKNPSPDNLGKAADEAVLLGANVVNNSYIGYGFEGTRLAKYYDHPGTIVTASAGDQGYGIGEPAGLPTVVAVGGTRLVKAHNERGWTETVWSGTGSGCERKLEKPAWQVDKRCGGRTMNDVAALADPHKGVAIYDSYHEKGWVEAGGTSAAAPTIAAVFGLAGNASSLNAAESLYAPGASLWDVTSGSNGVCEKLYLCNGRPGYDGPTGNGTPNGVGAF
jgi:subtilase family serine protease